MKKKICLMTQSLAGGGAERSTANLSKIFADLGFDVHIVSLVDDIQYEYCGTLLNLGKGKKKSLLNQFHRGMRFLQLRSYFKRNQFNFVIDNRGRRSSLIEFMYLMLAYSFTKVIYVVRSYDLSIYFPRNYYVAKLMIKKAFAVVGVSKEIASEINRLYRTNKTLAIYNPIDVQPVNDQQVCETNYILFIGRFVEEHKHISLLLKAYLLSNLRNEYKLVLQGEGKDRGLLEQLVLELGLEKDVIIKPFNTDVRTVLENAHFVVLSSHYEGFPRVLIEALSYGTPVVSVDCKSGPSEIIINEVNGLLVENYNDRALADAMNRMISDKELYQRCKANAISSVNHLLPDVIGAVWKKLLD